LKYFISTLAILFCASPLLAQQPSVSYLIADEAKSQMQIHGAFGIDSGSVSIEDTTLGIVSWSDSLIICNLPDSGKGAGGHVEVQTIHGVSNKRMLSIFSAMLDYLYWGWNGYPHDWFLAEGQRWNLNWRADIGLRHKNLLNHILFEISKSSYGNYIPVPYLPGRNFQPPDCRFPWRDSLATTDSSISLKGYIDLSTFNIKFDTLRMNDARLAQFFPGRYVPSTIDFDTTGHIMSYTHVQSHLPGESFESDSLYNAKILFPLGEKSSVSKLFRSNHEQITTFVNDHSIMLESATLLGSTTASLYTIDGRLLKQTKFDISAPGNYSIDVSDVHTRFAILVLQTGKGVITKKIIF
jgi:hypothetical protein